MHRRRLVIALPLSVTRVQSLFQEDALQSERFDQGESARSGSSGAEPAQSAPLVGLSIRNVNHRRSKAWLAALRWAALGWSIDSLSA